MDLTPEEQGLLSKFRKLPPADKDDLLAYAGSLLARAVSGTPSETDSAPSQCRLKEVEQRPEAKKTPIFTE